MPITKILCIKGTPANIQTKHLAKALAYIKDYEKTREGRFIGAVNCQADIAYEQMMMTKAFFDKTDKRQGYHIIISFRKGEISGEKAFEFMRRFAEEYLGNRFEGVYTVHENTDHVHGHLLFNSVSCTDGYKYRYNTGDWDRIIQPMVNRLAIEFHVSQTSIPSRTGRHSYEIENPDDRAYTGVWNDLIRRDIDTCVIFASSFNEILNQLEQMGYQVKCGGKYVAIKPQGMTKFRRLKSLGIDYTEETLRKRVLIEGKELYRKSKPYMAPKLKVYKIGFVRRTKLSGIRKMYVARMFRVRKAKRGGYAAAVKYKDDIKNFKLLQERYQYLSKMHISSIKEVHARKLQAIEERKEVYRKKNSIRRRLGTFNEMFAIVDRMNSLMECENGYRQGILLFEDEHTEYLKLEQELKGKGFTACEIIKIRDEYKEQFAKARTEEAKLTAEIKMLEAIDDDCSDYKEQMIEQQKERDKIRVRKQPPKVR